MKNTLLTSLLIITCLSTFAQKDSIAKAIQKQAETLGQGGNNEIKLNLLFSVIGIPEVSYEHFLADNIGIGASVFVGFDKSVQYKFGFIPHFRVYFGQKKASGFFIEGNTGIITSKDYYYYINPAISYVPGYTPPPTFTNKTNFGLGAAAGGKFLTRNGFLGEAYLGVGRLLGERSNYNDETYPRIGITIGKRF